MIIFFFPLSSLASIFCLITSVRLLLFVVTEGKNVTVAHTITGTKVLILTHLHTPTPSPQLKKGKGSNYRQGSVWNERATNRFYLIYLLCFPLLCAKVFKNGGCLFWQTGGGRVFGNVE